MAPEASSRRQETQGWIRNKRSDPTARPFAIIMKSADECQYACNYCYVEHAAGERTTLMRPETATRTIDLAVAHIGPRRKLNIVWHGGEPLLAGFAFFRDVLRHCERYSERSIEHCIQSNGLLLDRPFLDFCKERGVLVSVSLDGPRPIHDANRKSLTGVGTFDATMDAIRRIRDAGLQTGCVCVLNQNNVDEIDSLYTFFRREGIHFRINPVVRSGRAAAHYNALAISPKQYGQAMCRLFDLWFDDTGVIQVEPLQTILGNLLSPKVWGCDYQGRCLESILSINPDGTVFPCGRFAGLETFRLGNVHVDESFEQMFARDRYRTLLQRSRNTVPGCSECEFVEVCNTGCMITAHMSRGDLLAHDYYCAGRKMIFGHIVRRLHDHLREISTEPEGATHGNEEANQASHQEDGLEEEGVNQGQAGTNPWKRRARKGAQSGVARHAQDAGHQGRLDS